ncbi:MAG TPA: hypothetical protein VIH76_11160 [Candidatus Acidoferrales bacterium]
MLAQKQPSHHASADESYGNEDGIRPVTRRKYPARQKRGEPSFAGKKFKAIREKGIERHLLQNAESEVGPKPVDGHQVSLQMMWRAAYEADEDQSRGHGGECNCRLPGRGP